MNGIDFSMEKSPFLIVLIRVRGVPERIMFSLCVIAGGVSGGIGGGVGGRGRGGVLGVG